MIPEPKSGQCWIEYVCEHVPMGDSCSGCGFWNRTITPNECDLFGGKIDGKKNKVCLHNTQIKKNRDPA